VKTIIKRIGSRFLHSYPYRYVSALLAGALLPLAFAPYNWVVFALLSPAALFYLWRDADRKQAIWLSYAFGIGFFGLGVSWVSVSMVRYGGVALPLASLLTFLFAIILSSYIALLAYIFKRFFSQHSFTRQTLLVLPALWSLSEWLRGWLFTGFPWLNLGYSQTDGPLAGLAPLFGVYGLGYLLALGAALLLWAFCGNKRQRLIALAAAVSVSLLSLAMSQYPWASPYKEKIKVSLLQGNVPQNLKWEKDYRQASIDLYMRMTREHFDSQLIIWPETALPAYYHQIKFFLQQLADEAKAHDSRVLLGLAVIDENDNSRYYNSMALLGDPHQFYHKSHLVPFGEYLPLKFLLGEAIRFLKIPMADFSSGDTHQALMHSDDLYIGMSICYEDAFGEEVIRALPKANVLVNVSNDAWFGDSFAPHQHLQMARMRALETQRPMLRATNTGISAIIDEHGKIKSQSADFVTTVLTGEAQPMTGATPYVLWGNYPVVILSLVLILFAALKKPDYVSQSSASEVLG